MYITGVKLNNIYGFKNFRINFEEPSAGELKCTKTDNVIILKGANATGKTTLGKALNIILGSVMEANEGILQQLQTGENPAEFEIKMTNAGQSHSLKSLVNGYDVKTIYQNAEVDSFRHLRTAIGTFDSMTTSVDKGYTDQFLANLRTILPLIDPTIKNIQILTDLTNAIVINRHGKQYIIQNGKLLNKGVLSSGTEQGIDVAVFLTGMSKDGFYYCDDLLTNIGSEVRKHIIEMMMEHIGNSGQLIITERV